MRASPRHVGGAAVGGAEFGIGTGDAFDRETRLDATRADPGRWSVLFVLCVALVVVALDNTILNVALPSLVRELHASNSQLQWIVDAYTIVFASALLVAGSLGDRFGRKGALLCGLVVFGIGSVLSAFAGSAS